MDSPILVQHRNYISAIPWVLNNTGKIQVGQGQIISKLGNYVPTITSTACSSESSYTWVG